MEFGKEYIKTFDTEEQYNTLKASSNFIKPNVSIVKQPKAIHYNPRNLFEEKYLTFVAQESGTFKLGGHSINYSVDNGETWTALASNTDTPTVAAGQKIMWKASGLSSGIGKFSSTGSFTVEGNIMSLHFGDDFVGQRNLSGKSYVFAETFHGCTGLTSAENLVMPATTLEYACYHQMFWGCSQLTTAPKLPSTTLARSCYSHMFRDCTSLKTAPILSATTLNIDSYRYMFLGCTSLSSITCLATDINATECTKGWTIGAPTTGTFIKAASMNDWTTGVDGIPSNWTVQDAS